VRAVREGGAVERKRQLDAAKRMIETAAVLLAVDLLDALLFEPGRDFVVGDDGRAGAFGDVDGVADVVAVPVRDEDEVGLRLVRGDDGFRIAGEERINEDVIASRLERHGGVSQPANACSHREPPLLRRPDYRIPRSAFARGRANAK